MLRRRETISPPKVLLDEPYSQNLHVVGACLKCNNSSSADETYLACLVEAIVSGHPDDAERPVVRDALRHSPALSATILQGRTLIDGHPIFAVDLHRIERTVLKIARGHVAFELHENPCEEPLSITIMPFEVMNADRQAEFERHPGGEVWQEVGSRAMSRMAESLSTGEPLGWLEVQPGRYRYLVEVGAGRVVRFMLSEYLACEVVWNF